MACERTSHADLVLRRELLPPLWEASADCQARAAPTAEARMAARKFVYERARIIAQTLLDRERDALAEALAQTLGPQRAGDIADAVRRWRALDATRLVGTQLPRARVSPFRVLATLARARPSRSVEEASDLAGVERVIELASGDTARAYAEWRVQHMHAVLAEEARRNEFASLPQSTPETADIIAEVRRRAQEARLAALARSAGAQQRIADQHQRVLSALEEALPAGLANELREAMLHAAYGSAALDPWDFRRLPPSVRDAVTLPEDVRRALEEGALDSALKTRAEVARVVDSYWMEHLRTRIKDATLDLAARREVGMAYERSEARVAMLAQTLLSHARPDSISALTTAIAAWRAECAATAARQAAELRLVIARDVNSNEPTER